MQRLFLYLIFLTTLLAISCRNEPTIEQQMDQKTTVCYIAVAGKDTAWLKLDTAKYEPIGILEFNYPESKTRFLGEFKGKKFGDTIKGHYNFKINKVDKWYRNPVAFLKTDQKLTMGVGNFVTIWGSPQFDQKTPIDFHKGKFVFEEGNCGR